MIPCKECLKLALCKYKSYSTLLVECEDLFNILYHRLPTQHKGVPLKERNDTFSKHVIKLHQTLNPPRWTLYSNLLSHKGRGDSLVVHPIFQVPRLKEIDNDAL